MSLVAIVGAGPVGAAVAHRLAVRQRVTSIRLIDAQASVARGKALDIQQAGPVEGFDTTVSGTDDLLSATQASVIVLADDVAQGAWQGEGGCAVVARLLRAGAASAFVFAGPWEAPLMEACYRDLKVPAERLVGTGAAPVVGAVEALAGLEVGAAGVRVAVVGRAPDFVIGWSSATVGGAMLSDCVAAHRLSVIGQAVRRLWPPGPYAIASATAPVVEGLIAGSRVPLAASTVIDGEFGARGVSVLMPVELGRLRVQARRLPSLSPQERTGLVNSLGTVHA